MVVQCSWTWRSNRWWLMVDNSFWVLFSFFFFFCSAAVNLDGTCSKYFRKIFRNLCYSNFTFDEGLVVFLSNNS